MKFSNYFILCVVIIFLKTVNCFGQLEKLHLQYDQPAQQWEQTLPLGNGRLGMTTDGGINTEKIVLNDITLWSGSSQDANNYDANKRLPEIRELLLNGKNDEAQRIMDKDFICTGQGSGNGVGANVPFGCYQLLGNLELQFAHTDTNMANIRNYKRTLSLNNAVATCTYEADGVKYTREYFSSFDDDVDVISIHSDKVGKINCTISITRPERFAISVSNEELQMSGRLNNGTDGNGMQYVTRIKPVVSDGRIAERQNSMVIENATELVIYISSKTDYKDKLFKKNAEEVLHKAVRKTYALQKHNHIRAYQKLFNRVSFNLGAPATTEVPTNIRLEKFQLDPAADKGLAALYYQFGRYLSISSTRVGLLPPNLQGLWANQIQTPWNGDYHMDINIQMNQWPVEVSNLSELNLPLAALVKGMVAQGEKTAKAYYNADGWIAHVITNIWGYTEPGESASWGITKVGSGWLCNNLWEHYLFTTDKAYLKDIYPVLKGAALFYNSILVKDPVTGWLVTSPSESPENGFILPNGNHASICMGPTIDNQIIRELFTNVVTASRQLGQDAELRERLSARLQQIPPAGVIAKDGRLIEWLQDYKELEPHHRCISHLYGLFPGALITPEATPDLAAASKKTLEARGDDGPGFSIAHKVLWWARLHDGNRAFKLFKYLVRPTLATNMNYGDGGGIYPNFLSAGPPFQIDANFGGTAGIAEMLLQSHAGYIDLLPAIPDAWKAAGEIKGLKARGNFTVDFKWKNGKVTSFKISAPQPRKVKVKVNGLVTEIIAQRLYIVYGL